MAARTQRGKAEIDARYQVSRDELAHILGVSPQYLSNLVARGMPKRGHGRYHLPECVQWYLDATRAGETDGEESVDVVAARTELYRAQTQAKKLETELAAGRVIPQDDVREMLLTLGSLINSTLEGRAIAVSPELASLGDAAAIQARLLAEHRDIRAALAGELERLVNGHG